MLEVMSHPTKENNNMNTLAELVDRHGVDVLEHLEREALVPVNDCLQMQGDVAVIPTRPGKVAKPAVTVPAEGIPVVRGENGGNTHLLLADGPVEWVGFAPSNTDVGLGILDVPDGSTAWLAHPEHGYLGIAPGCYRVNRQREQADEIRQVQD